jgi:hypothetical protein
MRTTMRPNRILLLAVMASLIPISPGVHAAETLRPVIRTLDLDMVEATPVLFKLATTRTL